MKAHTQKKPAPLAAQPLTAAAFGLLQRECACGGKASGPSGKCEGCKAGRLGQRAASSAREHLREPAGGLPPTAFGHSFDHVQVHRDHAETPQSKLVVGRAGDAYEQEADRVAEQVTRVPETSASMTTSANAAPGSLQRACAACEEELLRKDAGRGESDASVAASGGQPVPADLSSQIESLRKGGGTPLPGSVRAHFEPRFGYDFGHVRIHADGRAAQTARRLDAHAYTVGHDIVFDAGRYAPETSEGRRLLAHELTHVVQQGGAAPRDGGRIRRQPAGKPAAPAKEEPWVKDSDGSLYYKTEAEAERRKATLEKAGGYKEYRVVSFKSKGTTYWRVEMRGPQAGKGAGDKKETPKAPDAKDVPKDAAPGKKEGEAGKGEGKKEEGDKKSEEPKKSEEAGGKKVCLTFDDGPEAGTENVLDVLDSKGAVATFFLTGQNMASDATRQGDLVKRMLKKHQIGNHTFTHNPATKKGYRAAYGDLSDPAQLKKFQENYRKNEEHFKKLLGTLFPGFKLARLPGDGRLVEADGKLILVIATEKMGMAHATWQFEFAPNGVFGWVPNNDWQGVAGAAATFMRLPHGNDIILFHDRHWKGKNKSVFEGIISKLIAKSFTFGKLSSAGKCG